NFIMRTSGFTHPSAYIAREIENIIITGENSDNYAVKAGCAILSRLISFVVFPIFLTLELVLKRIPKLLLRSISICKSNDPKATKKFNRTLDKVNKFALGVLFSPMGICSPDIVSGLFLKPETFDAMIRPFGVEEQFGKKVEKIHYP